MTNSFQYKTNHQIHKECLQKMYLEAVCAYQRELRRYEASIDKPLESSELKKKLYFLAQTILRIDRITTGRKLNIFDDKREISNTTKGKVYACSHVGRYDIESALEAIGEQVYFVMGDAEETYLNLEGFFLDHILGRICFDTGYQAADIFEKHRLGIPLTKEEEAIYLEYKKDREIGEDTCTKRVQRGDNILIYPEGAWNYTWRVIQQTYKGTARIAQRGNGILVPIGVLRDGLSYSVNLGKEMNIDGAQENDINDINKELRERIGSLNYEMIFNPKSIFISYTDSDEVFNINLGEVSRKELGTFEEISQAFKDDILKESANGYGEEAIEATRYHDSNAPENVLFGPQYVKKSNNV